MKGHTTIVPQLVIDRETGKLCVMVSMGSESAILDLPDNLATATKEELQEYMNHVVPGMVAGLIERRKKQQKALRKKAENAQH